MNLTNVENPIVFFDSGVGGLTVLYQCMDAMPHENYIYYADIANMPYGNKDRTTVQTLVLNAVEALVRKENFKALVIACNTATSVSIELLRAKYTFPVIGMEPAVKPAIQRTTKGKVLVLATELTLKESKFHQLVSTWDQNDKIVTLAMPELVEAAEAFDFESGTLAEQVKKKLATISLDDIETVVLGCTHFIYFYPLLRNIFPRHIHIIDGNIGTVNRVKSLVQSKSFGSGSLRCLISGQPIDNELIQPYFDQLSSIEAKLMQMN